MVDGIEFPEPKDIDVKKAADEIKAFIFATRYDMVDPSRHLVEGWVDPSDEKYPELRKFATQWEAFLDTPMSVGGTEVPEGEPIPEALAPSDAVKAEFVRVSVLYEEIIKQIQDTANSDQDFWYKLRGEIVPLYSSTRVSRGADGQLNFELSDEKTGWEERWKQVKIFYDPVGLHIASKYKLVGKETKKVYKEKEVSDRDIPQGFVIQII